MRTTLGYTAQIKKKKRKTQTWSVREYVYCTYLYKHNLYAAQEHVKSETSTEIQLKINITALLQTTKITLADSNVCIVQQANE